MDLKTIGVNKRNLVDSSMDRDYCKPPGSITHGVSVKVGHLYILNLNFFIY